MKFFKKKKKVFMCVHSSPSEYGLKPWTASSAGDQGHRSEERALFWKLSAYDGWHLLHLEIGEHFLPPLPHFFFASTACWRTVTPSGCWITEELLRSHLGRRAFGCKLALKSYLVSQHVTSAWLNFLQSQGFQATGKKVLVWAAGMFIPQNQLGISSKTNQQR